MKTYLSYQNEGIAYALARRGTIIADEMGLGKTVQAIGVANAMQARHVKVVCPAFLKRNWRNELDAWLTYKPEKLQIISYASQTELKSDIAFDLLILDEAHYLKNPTSARSERVLALAPKASRVVLLTGTPVLNHPIELWTLLCIAAPDVWNRDSAYNVPRDAEGNVPGYVILPQQKKTHPGQGPAFWTFARRYCDLKRVQHRAKGGKLVSAWDFSGASNIGELGAKLKASCMIRRMKSDVLSQLPPKRRQLIVLDSKADDSDLNLPEVTGENYEEILSKLHTEKVLFDEWSKRRKEQALAKVEGCLRFIGDLLDEKQKVIVFAHHLDVVQKLYDGLIAELTNAADYLVKVTGETPMQMRDAAVQAFQTDANCRIFLGTIGAAGVGLTLTASSHVVFCELDPRPGILSQAEDRAHRIGQRESVLVQHLVANGSLCARLARIAVRKQAVLSELDGAVVTRAAV